MIRLISIHRKDPAFVVQECVDILREHKRIILQSGVVRVVFLETIEYIRKLERLLYLISSLS